MTNEEIARFFNDTRAFIQGNPDLRDPQVEGWFRTRQRATNSIFTISLALKRRMGGPHVPVPFVTIKVIPSMLNLP